jgi:hypothetical protein
MLRLLFNQKLQIILMLLILPTFLVQAKAWTENDAGNIFLPLILNKYAAPELIYHSQNLNDHEIFAECNPGGTSSCPCSTREAAINAFETYGEVVSNPRQINTYVNAIGFKKFVETYLDGELIGLGTVKYRGQIRLPVLPVADVNQKTNPQAVHFMIQLWDGRNALFPANKYSREAVIYWELNPWVADYGKVKIYISPLNLIDTGIKLTPDTNWHTFELVADLSTQKYQSISVDGEKRDLQSYEMAAVYHPDWGSEVALSITTESMASWSGSSCDYIFTWTTQFRNLEFFQVK